MSIWSRFSSLVSALRAAVWEGNRIWGFQKILTNYVYFKENVCSSDCDNHMAGRVLKNWIRNDVGRSTTDLIWGTSLEFVLKDWGKQWKFSRQQKSWRNSKHDSSIREGHSVKILKRICGNKKKESRKRGETACNKEFHKVYTSVNINLLEPEFYF